MKKGGGLVQTVTLRLKLYRPTAAKREVYRELTRRTTALANNLIEGGRPHGLTSKSARPYLGNLMPSVLICQTLRDVQASKVASHFRVLPPHFNNQNMRFRMAGDRWTASFPTHEGRIRVPVAATERQADMLSQLGTVVKQGAARLYEKRGRWYLALSVTVQETPCVGTKVAGVDLGLRNLAVVNCDGKTLFFNGNEAAYARRRMSSVRRKMGQAKALSAIRRMSNKEQRWMENHDHQISRSIVNWCVAHGVGTIRVEDLGGIRNKRKRDRKDRGRSLHSWSFHRLQRFIEYKANLAGVRFEHVVPNNTSRTCPKCGVVDKSSRNGITFHCKHCAYHGHADAVGALNISRAISGLAAA